MDRTRALLHGVTLRCGRLQNAGPGNCDLQNRCVLQYGIVQIPWELSLLFDAAAGKGDGSMHRKLRMVSLRRRILVETET